MGFAKTQWQLFTKESIYKVKPLLYVYRVLLTGIYLLNTGKIEASLVNLNQNFQLSYINELIDRKSTSSEKSLLNEIDLEFYDREYQRLQNELEEAFHNSHLPNDPAAKLELNNLLIQLRLS